MSSKHHNQNQLVQSPCVANCCLDQNDICMGCYRHLDEITAWHSSNSQQRLEILNRCNQRKSQHS